MGRVKRFPCQKACTTYQVALGLPDDPFAGLIGMEVPSEGAKAVGQNFQSALRTPDLDWNIRSVVVVSEKRVETRHVIHVKVGKEKMIDPLDFRRFQVAEAALTAIEEKSIVRLAGIHRDQERVIGSGGTEDFPVDCHGSAGGDWINAGSGGGR